MRRSQTQFGWHVIRLDDVRDTQFPPLEQVTPQIRLILEFLNVIAVRSGKEPPIQVAWIISRRILAVFSELD